MDKQIKIEENEQLGAFAKINLLGTSKIRNLNLDYEFAYNTESNPTWDNYDECDHYLELLNIKLGYEKIAKFYKDDIDKLIVFLDKIKKIRKENKSIINKNVSGEVIE